MKTLIEILDIIKTGKPVFVGGSGSSGGGFVFLAAKHAQPEAIVKLRKHGEMLLIGAHMTQKSRATEVPNDFIMAMALRRWASENHLAELGQMASQEINEGACLISALIPAAIADLCRLASGIPKGIAVQVEKNPGFPASSMAEVIEHRLRHESLVSRINSVNMPTAYGNFRLQVYSSHFDPARGIDLALTSGGDSFTADQVVTVRVHSEWSVANIVNRLAHEEGSSLNRAMERIASSGEPGVIIFLRNTPEQAAHSALFRHGKRPCDLWIENGKIRTLAPEHMSFGIGAQILRDLGVRKMKLLNNAPVDASRLACYGLELIAQEAFG
jgi:GTP cyclohydrolase II